MKTKLRIIIVCAILFLSIGLVLTYCQPTPEPLPNPTPIVPDSTTTTYTQIYNATDSIVTVYVTVGAVWGCVHNVLDISWVTDTVPGQLGMQGTFTLAPGDSTVKYAPDTLGFNGVISFNFPPANCPGAGFENGINQYEFMVNNSFQIGQPQESIDISCVHGTNCVIRVNMVTKNTFNAGPLFPNISTFVNSLDRSAVGLPGVYPYGCDTCTMWKSPPSCIPLPQPVQKNKICQIQRPASQSNGLLQVIYLGKEQPLK